MRKLTSIKKEEAGMADYVILTDSTCDLPAEVAERNDLLLVHLSVLLEGKVYTNYLDGRELSYEDFYGSMRNKKLPTTSAVNMADFLDTMEPVLEEGKDILYIGFSSTMSGTYNAGCAAARELLEKYPDRKILTVDSRCATTGEGLLVELCAMEKAKGKSIDEVAKFAEDNKMRIRHMFTVDDLFHLVRGGRTTRATAIIGSMLGIKPMLTVNIEGLVDAFDKTRGRKKAFKMIVEDVAENITDPSLPLYVSHGDDEKGAEELAAMIKERVGCTDIRISYLGVVCGCHGGPGLVGVFYYGKERTK